ncbi:zinc-dependent alcohol dehydrogenase [Veronia nyctiphanis]|nr:alcohol dehydrogenase catalytic domain-containing protein [Veronia nyctiphanis]
MKALVYAAKEHMELRNEPEPVAEQGEVIVRILKAGICGSDMHAYHGHDPRRVPPLILGHEACGIAESGKYKGQKVVLNPLITCGECNDCLTGRQNLCQCRTAIGLKKPGAFADFTAIPERNLIPVPNDMPAEHAALAEPTATAVHAVALGERHTHRPLSEYKILVIGAGSIGLLTALLLQYKGCMDVTVSDTNSLRLTTCQQVGIDKVHNPLNDAPHPENHFDWVIDAVGSAITRDVAMHAIRPGGVFIHVGLQDASGTFDVRKMTLQEVAVIGAFSYTQTDMKVAVDYLYSGALGTLNWIEERQLSEGAAAFSDLDQGKTAAAKIILQIADMPG